MNGIPQSINEIIAVDKIKKKSFMKNYNIVIKKIYPKLNIKTQTFTPIDYVVKFCKELEITSECENYSIKLIEKAQIQNMFLAGKDPRGFAAASIYIALKAHNKKKTQKEIARVANITEVTLRKRLNELYKFAY